MPILFVRKAGARVEQSLKRRDSKDEATQTEAHIEWIAIGPAGSPPPSLPSSPPFNPDKEHLDFPREFSLPIAVGPTTVTPPPTRHRIEQVKACRAPGTWASSFTPSAGRAVF